MSNIKELIDQFRGNPNYLEQRLKQLISQYEDELKSLKNVSLKDIKEELLVELEKKISQMDKGMDMNLISKIVKNLVSDIKGDKGDSPTKEELINMIEPLIPKPIKGDPGINGRTPIHIGKLPPVNPQKGDLWYQD